MDCEKEKIGELLEGHGFSCEEIHIYDEIIINITYNNDKYVLHTLYYSSNYYHLTKDHFGESYDNKDVIGRFTNINEVVDKIKELSTINIKKAK